MKQMMLTTLMMMVMTWTAFAGNPELNCRDAFVQSTDISQKARISADLIGGIWQIESTAEGTIGEIIFHEFGVADEILPDEEGGKTLKQVQWTLEEYNNAIFLVISHRGDAHQTNLYRLAQTCEGMDLTDVGSLRRLQLRYEGKKLASIKNLSQYLTGEWITDTYPFDLTNSVDDCGTFKPMDDAFLQMSFRMDGTYARSIGNRGYTLRETGFWDIADDGRYLLMHVQNPQGTGIVRTDVAEITQAGDGSFHLRQALKNAQGDDLFCTKVKETGYQRWNP